MLKDRLPHEANYNKNDYFHIETRHLFRNLIKLIVDCENKIEEWRANLESMPYFSIRDTFDRIDIRKRNYLTKEDVS